MNRKFLIATHGAFAEGVKSSLNMIIGPTDNVFVIQAYLQENKPLDEEIERLLQADGEAAEWVVFSDLLGGSVNNQVLRYALWPNVHVVSGFNLPLLIEIVMSDPAAPVREVIENALTAAREQMVYVNKLITGQ
ncbi:MAG TPA: PTS sugar transporter subunit IIA [Dinghuibacter sp.]|jgi:mannose/fructose-specific phosphotransferase system component IIA|uniref:PTS sugar transporter subunit IIA n=1 Tax=Dinghuibacter sp. TaxID=2024697 RepID=UPI002C73A64E|nr:PTS sugar transporter subunit IIA [Dinghuibacter sp.]HTJ10881.1 PTS sugar transporter subunit IIA [Dinghuibacter sp.]